MNPHKEKEKQFSVSPQPAQTVLSVSAQTPLTLQTPPLLLQLSASGAQVPEKEKEHTISCIV